MIVDHIRQDAEVAVPAYDEARPLPLERDDRPNAEAEIDPLFAPSIERSILLDLLAVWRPGLQIDTSAAIDQIARHGIVERPRRIMERAVSAGVQILNDTSPAMDNFRADQRQMIGRLRSLIPREGLAIVACSGPPAPGELVWQERGLSPDDSHEARYVFPPRGTPVLALSTLGMTRRGGSTDDYGAEAWIEFAFAVRARDCPLLALTPIHPSRLPRKLTRLVTALHWDRTTRSLPPRARSQPA